MKSQPPGDAYGEALRLAQVGDRSMMMWELDNEGEAYVELPHLEFKPFHEWAAIDQLALEYVKGRVLDIGCGAGRIALHLQDQGHEVVAIDRSPGAVAIAQSRGVRDVRLLNLRFIDASLGSFDTILLLGSNAGLLASPDGIRQFLSRAAEMLSPEGLLIASAFDTHRCSRDDGSPDWAERLARARKLPGERRLRLRVGDVVGPWFRYAFLSMDELCAIIEPAGWTIRTAYGDERAFMAVVEKVAGM